MARVKDDPEFYWRELRKPLTTWLTEEDHVLFRSIAQLHHVTAATFLRAIVIDVLAEERDKFLGPCSSRPERILPVKALTNAGKTVA